jgi:methylthioribulose-1-phosphate dehydratase
MSVPQAVAEAICAAGRRMDALGFVPATAGNISIRLDAQRLAVTVSGRHKGFLQPDDVMVVDLDGTPEDPLKRSSAETLLHCGIYRRFPAAGAALHGHSIANTVLSRAARGGVALAGYELLKAFPGLATHDADVTVPVVPNDQDIARMQRGLDALWDRTPDAPPGYLIAGHGSYVWAPDMAGALARLEALEFMLACELQQRRVAP